MFDTQSYMGVCTNDIQYGSNGTRRTDRIGHRTANEDAEKDDIRIETLDGASEIQIIAVGDGGRGVVSRRPEFFAGVRQLRAMGVDVSVFGRYTYLVTELFWGLIAAALLRRSGAERRAARTILALYPLGYLWDRYTLEAGVFEIPLRTGVEVAGIPIEEHLFMLVVPSMVIGAHETLCEVVDA